MTSRVEPSVELSIIIPCLDVAAVLPAQLEALSRETATFPWEVIVVDNGSADATAATARSFAGRVHRLRVVAEPRRGRHHACNRGAAIAAGRSLAFVDADDVVVGGYVSAMAAALRGATVVAGRLIHGNGADSPVPFGRVQSDGLMPTIGFKPYAAGCNFGVAKEAFESVGGFTDDVPYGEDVDISWRLLAAGHSIVFAPAAAIEYAQRSGVRAMFRQHRRFGRAHALLYRKYAAAGMPRRSWRAIRSDWWQTLRAVPFMYEADVRARVVRRLARNLGRIHGSITAGVLYL